MSTPLYDIPQVQRLAEALAREYQGAAEILGRHLLPHPDVHLALLCDLTRPASRDALARLCLEARGYPPSPTAPSLTYSPGRPPNSVGSWTLQDPESSKRAIVLLHYPAEIEAVLGPPIPVVQEGRRLILRLRDLPTDATGALTAMIRGVFLPEGP